MGMSCGALLKGWLGHTERQQGAAPSYIKFLCKLGTVPNLQRALLTDKVVTTPVASSAM